MAHVMLAAQQAYHMKMAIAEMDCKTAYMVFDFKQKFLAKGFREGGDSYYGKKGILWFGAGVHIKANGLQEEARSNAESIEQLYVEIDFTDDCNRSPRSKHVRCRRNWMMDQEMILCKGRKGLRREWKILAKR